jgi:hypothetical protein
MNIFMKSKVKIRRTKNEFRLRMDALKISFGSKNQWYWLERKWLGCSFGAIKKREKGEKWFGRLR